MDTNRFTKTEYTWVGTNTYTATQHNDTNYKYENARSY